jgi:tRNA-splicing endonuclease subunit Sen15, fungi type
VKYPPLSAAIKRYPHAASTIFQTYNDLLLGESASSRSVMKLWLCNLCFIAQQWSELEIVDLPACGRCGFMGRRPESVSSRYANPFIYDSNGVFPSEIYEHSWFRVCQRKQFLWVGKLNQTKHLWLKDNDHSARLKSAFSDFGHPSEVFLAISAEDSSIVYYKLSMGINKPPV